MRLLVVVLLALGAARAERPRLKASPVSGPIIVDGQLDEPAWAEATVGSRFTERTPNPGAKAAVRTEVRVLHDASALYVAVTSYAAPGEIPRGLEMTRDSFNVFSDDTITLKFDVHRDERSTIGLAVNAAGAKLDYIAVGLERRGFRAEFDAVWSAGVSIEEGRWTVEYRVPYLALGLSEGDGLLGFQVTRDHAARTATYDWSPMPPEFGPVAATHYGTLEGPSSTATGHPVTVVPYVLAETEGDRLDQRWGGDVRARLGEDVWGELTFNTDFAEVDLDQARVNLDRFQLFFPEKRAFFLRGIDVFEFGSPGAVQPFFSRRVGLDVPLWTGAKLYGRSGAMSFGVLDAVTEEEDALTNTFVGRARADASGSGVGAIFTHRAPVEDVDDPTVDYGWGVDATLLAGDSRLALDGFYAGALKDLPGDNDHTQGQAAQAQVRWRGDAWTPQVSARVVEEDYEPALGFASRTGSALYRVYSPWVFRFPDTWLWAVEPAVYANVFTPVDSVDVDTLDAGAEFGATFAGGWQLSTQALYVEDEVADAFSLAGLEVQPGRYEGPGALVGFQSPGTSNPGGTVGWFFRDEYFGGTLHNVTVTGRASFGPHVRLDASVSSARIELPECGDTDPDCTVTTHAFNGGLRLAATPQLFANFTGRYDSVSELVQWLARLRWTYAPGSDFFLVYRYGVDDDPDTDDYRVTLKLAHRFDGLL